MKTAEPLDPYNPHPTVAATLRVADLDDSDKPREKALNLGIDALSQAELLAIIIGSGLPGKSVIDLSREILRDNDNRLSRVARMSIHEFSAKYAGIGPAKAVSIAAAFELAKRYRRDLEVSDPQVTGSDSVYSRMRGRLEALNHEEFWVVHLNRANRIIFEECISRGGTAATTVDVKLVIKRALDKLSSAIVLVHNHPSGTLVPSIPDNQLTKRIKTAAEYFDIRVVDHLIISSLGYYSYNDKGML